jgi:hypothetical protein
LEASCLGGGDEPGEAAASTRNYDDGQNVSDFRYPTLKRYLAKQFHPDYAPGHGIEKVVRTEIFKEIWSEIERLDHQSVSASSARARSFCSTIL